jgi:hypothetical protein
LVAELSAQRSDLVHQNRAEEYLSKQSDPTHYAYSPLAASLRARIENLDRSIVDLNSQMALLKDQIPLTFRVQPVEGNSSFETFASETHTDVGRPTC